MHIIIDVGIKFLLEKDLCNIFLWSFGSDWFREKRFSIRKLEPITNWNGGTKRETFSAEINKFSLIDLVTSHGYICWNITGFRQVENVPVHLFNLVHFSISSRAAKREGPKLHLLAIYTIDRSNWISSNLFAYSFWVYLQSSTNSKTSFTNRRDMILFNIKYNAVDIFFLSFFKYSLCWEPRRFSFFIQK